MLIVSEFEQVMVQHLIYLKYLFQLYNNIIYYIHPSNLKLKELRYYFILMLYLLIVYKVKLKIRILPTLLISVYVTIFDIFL